MKLFPKILVACDKFKGSLEAESVCAAIARGLEKAVPGAQIETNPIADGGEGFAASLIRPLQGHWVVCEVRDPLGRLVPARYVLGVAKGERVAVLEMAEASGMWRVAQADRAILRSNTYGTGELMRHAVVHGGAQRIIVGLGGSATNDGGAGMASALGMRFLDAGGGVLEPFPESLAGRLKSVDSSGVIPLPPLAAACDVDNPLLGPKGATRVFGPQKGAGEMEIPILEDALQRMVDATGAGFVAQTPGAGAAGGLGFGLMAYAGAELVPGFDLMANLTGLESRILDADWVVTGEGSLDSQSLGGKGPVALARMAKKMGKTVIVVCGRAEEGVSFDGIFDHVLELRATGLPLKVLMKEAERLLERVVTEHPFIS